MGGAPGEEASGIGRQERGWLGSGLFVATTFVVLLAIAAPIARVTLPHGPEPRAGAGGSLGTPAGGPPQEGHGIGGSGLPVWISIPSGVDVSVLAGAPIAPLPPPVGGTPNAPAPTTIGGTGAGGDGSLGPASGPATHDFDGSAQAWLHQHHVQVVHHRHHEHTDHGHHGEH